MCYNFHKIIMEWETKQSYNCAILTVSQNNKNSIISSKNHYVENQTYFYHRQVWPLISF